VTTTREDATTTRVRPGNTPETSRQVIAASLHAVRNHLGMDVAFVGRFEHGRRIFEFVDDTGSFCPVAPGGSDPVEDTYCHLVASGRIPELIPDTSAVAAVQDVAATHDLPVGSHLSVPLRAHDGATFGTFCCFSRRPRPDLRHGDLNALRVVGDIVAAHLHYLLGHREASEETYQRVTAVLESGGPTMALQPVFDLRRDRVDGYEALARFGDDVDWTPDQWFAEAATIGLGPQLEAAAVASALRMLPRLPDDTSLGVNVSAGALTASDEIVQMLTGSSPRRLVLELTEHERLSVGDGLSDRLAQLRDAGVRIAADDAGSGYAGLEHILQLDPDVLKLDRTLVQGIADDPARQAMCDAMVRFVARTGAALVAEGVETQAQHDYLASAGCDIAQGYLHGRPVPVDELPALLVRSLDGGQRRTE
jgi:EAL domain-containing protein (putative c-di-GMP-specific phosphodiesterase class I)